MQNAESPILAPSRSLCHVSFGGGVRCINTDVHGLAFLMLAIVYNVDFDEVL